MTLGILLAAATLLPPPPAAPLPNTEAVTNVPLVVEVRRLGTVRLSVTLDASPSNNVELAVGTDANGDGVLSLEEADFSFGYDCGKWFYADTETGEVSEEDAPTEGRVARALEIRRRKFNPSWNMLRLVRRGTGATAEVLDLDRHYPGLLLELK